MKIPIMTDVRIIIFAVGFMLITSNLTAKIFHVFCLHRIGLI